REGLGAERQRLGTARLATVAGWPRTLELGIDGLGHVLVCHSTPGSEDPIYTRLTPQEELLSLFAGVEAEVVLCGHTHMQYDRQLSNGLRVVNPGSVGLPYEGSPGAYWALLGPGVEFRRSAYDVEAAASAIRALGTAVQEDVLGRLVHPPTSDEATAEFEKLRGA
ncbi:MAG TPA: metallophosphoesterase family protein, partial [Gaiellaceae bacterium]|nr:metallophosphoesterase family protein [Gaiellaceae bacterium]